ncbi:hypothetical protein DFH28DRAFT_921650 [Melampsora americana]|nr:hypothetical protein DFH28DRAFT_921650 [Melampsora americana]
MSLLCDKGQRVERGMIVNEPWRSGRLLAQFNWPNQLKLAPYRVESTLGIAEFQGKIIGATFMNLLNKSKPMIVNFSNFHAQLTYPIMLQQLPCYNSSVEVFGISGVVAKTSGSCHVLADMTEFDRDCIEVEVDTVRKDLELNVKWMEDPLNDVKGFGQIGADCSRVIFLKVRPPQRAEAKDKASNIENTSKYRTSGSWSLDSRASGKLWVIENDLAHPCPL